MGGDIRVSFPFKIFVVVSFVESRFFLVGNNVEETTFTCSPSHVSCLYYYLGCNVSHVRFHVCFRSTEHTYVNDFDSTTKNLSTITMLHVEFEISKLEWHSLQFFSNIFHPYTHTKGWRLKQKKSMISTSTDTYIEPILYWNSKRSSIVELRTECDWNKILNQWKQTHSE